VLAGSVREAGITLLWVESNHAGCIGMVKLSARMRFS